MTEVVVEPTVRDAENQLISSSVNEEHVEEEDETLDDEYEDDEEEAEEIARRLKEQLWADISKAQAAQASQRIHDAGAPTAATSQHCGGDAAGEARKEVLSSKELAALDTMKNILALTAKDAVALSTLSSTLMPGSNDNLLAVLSHIVDSGVIPVDLAKKLSPILVSLARTDALFATVRKSNIPAVQLDKGKRRREESDEEQYLAESRMFKRSNIVHTDIEQRISDAVRVVSNALSVNAASGEGPLDPSLISSIQLQLHQIFLFSMTSSAGGGQEMHILQETGGLVQVIGVLSGIQIGPTPPPQGASVPMEGHIPGTAPFPARPWTSLQATDVSLGFSDIGTAVYPCLMMRCRKIFSRLFSLRAHQRVHGVQRPFRCTTCPASFSRNHDLKRHTKLHEKKAWQCAGCEKMFSRRDAIKRHKNSSAARGAKGELCVNAAIREVELDRNGDEDLIREGRRAKMWTDIVTNSVGGVGDCGGSGEQGSLEEGEVHDDVIRRMQAAVLSLHPMLQAHVSRALGTDHAAPPLHLDPTGGQATLASVIARAQMQSMALQLQPQVPPADGSQGSHNAERSFTHTNNDAADSARPPDLHPTVEASLEPGSTGPTPRLSLYGLSEEQRILLEQAIANAASAAQAQAEAEAALEEEVEQYSDGDESDV